MVKKTLLSMAIAAAVVSIAGCNVSSTDKYDNSVSAAPVAASDIKNADGTPYKQTQVIYDPSGKNAAGLPNIPLITDLLLSGLADPDGLMPVDGTIPFPGGAIKIGDEGYNPIFSAVNELDGFSTSSAIDVPFSAPLNPASIVTAPGPKANVLLIPLNYINDPVLGGKPANNDDPALNVASPFGAPASIEASVVSYTDVENDLGAPVVPVVLRIMPKEPLKPATRYLVVITDGVTDHKGNAVKASGTFSLLANTTQAPADETTATLQGAIQNWVGLATGFTNKGLGQSLTASNIAYATTFTTGGTTRVLEAMAAPSLVNPAVKQNLPASIRYQIERALVENEGKVPEATQQVVVVITGMAGSSDPTTKATGQALIAALGGAENMAANLGAAVTLAKNLPQVAPRVAQFDPSHMPLSASMNMANGTIKLPYYLSAPQINPAIPATEATAARVIANYWQADNTLAEDLGSLLTAAGIPAEAVTPPSTNVTRHFPLAKTGDHTGEDGMGLVDVPISVFYSPDCTGKYNPIIYQHGITSKRTAAVPFAGVAMNPAFGGDVCNATVAIDLPLHGLEATDGDFLVPMYGAQVGGNQGLAVQLGLSKQRHFGLTADAELQPKAMDATDSKSGSLFINILNFQTTRDNLRQAVVDQLNLNASVKFLDINNDGTPDINPAAKVKFVGHSLGAIVGTNVVALANKLGGENGENAYINQVEAAVLANGSGNITKMLENSPSFAPTILGGFAGLGNAAGLDLSQGSSILELTLHILQATIDSADPINFADMMKTNEHGGVLAFEVVGDGTAANLPDTVVPPAAFAANGLAPMVLNDTETANDKFADTASAPLAGSTPLASFSGLKQADAAVTSGADYLRKVVKFTQGNHSSFGMASLLTATPAQIDVELATQAGSFLATEGKGLTVTNSTVVKSAE